MINENAPMAVSYWFKVKPYLSTDAICEGLDLNATEQAPSEIQNLELSDSESNTKKFAVIIALVNKRINAFVFRWDKEDKTDKKRGDNVLDIEQVKVEDGKPWCEWTKTPDSDKKKFHHPIAEFGWNDILGKVKEHLTQKPSTDEIKGSNSLCLRLNDKKTEVNVEIDGKTIDKLIANPNNEHYFDIKIPDPLFNWNEVQKNSNGRLIEFLCSKFGVDWVKLANVEKSADDRTITISTQTNRLSLKLNDEGTRVNLQIDNNRTYEFIAKTESGKQNINIYETPPVFEGKLTFYVKRYQKKLDSCSYVKKACQNTLSLSSYVTKPAEGESHKLGDTVLSKSAILMASLLFFMFVFPTLVNATSWTVSYNSPEQSIRSLAVYNGKLYAGTENYGSIYVYDGSSWNISYESQASAITSFAVYDGKLYATGQSQGHIYVYDGTSWGETYVDVAGGYDYLNGAFPNGMSSMKVYNNKLYAAEASGGGFYVYNGTSWNRNPDIQPHFIIASLEVYDGKLYASTSGDGKIYAYDGNSWNVSYTSRDRWINSFAVYNGKLYAGTTERANIYVYDGTSWAKSYENPTNDITALFVYDNKLYAVGAGGTPGRIIYVYGGNSWKMADSSAPYGSVPNGLLPAWAVYNNKLYAGEYASDKGRVYEVTFAPEPTPTQIASPTAIPIQTLSPTFIATPTFERKLVVNGTAASECIAIGMEYRSQRAINGATVSECVAKNVTCDGCLYADSSCIPFGTRLGPQYSVVPFNGSASYCDAAKKAIEPQKADGVKCQNNYECISNYCSDGVCGNLQNELSATRGLLEQILGFLRAIFGRFFPFPVAK